MTASNEHGPHHKSHRPRTVARIDPKERDTLDMAVMLLTARMRSLWRAHKAPVTILVDPAGACYAVSGLHTCASADARGASWIDRQASCIVGVYVCPTKRTLLALGSRSLAEFLRVDIVEHLGVDWFSTAARVGA